MNIHFLIFFVFLLTSCGTLFSKGGPRQGKITYTYFDVSGQFGFSRESKLLKNKLITRTQISSSANTSSKVLEKSITVSELGTIKSNKTRSVALRPLASEFTVWLEGKRYLSKMRMNSKTKMMDIHLENPSDGTKKQSVSFPRGKDFCFFSQLPDCLYHNLFLTKALEKKNQNFDLYVIWDSYPYIQEQLNQVGQTLFAPAILRFEGKSNGLLHYVVEVDGQIVSYHFSKSLDMVKMSWIAQGITILPPGEDISSVGDE